MQSYFTDLEGKKKEVEALEFLDEIIPKRPLCSRARAQRWRLCACFYNARRFTGVLQALDLAMFGFSAY